MALISGQRPHTARPSLLERLRGRWKILLAAVRALAVMKAMERGYEGFIG